MRKTYKSCISKRGCWSLYPLRNLHTIFDHYMNNSSSVYGEVTVSDSIDFVWELYENHCLIHTNKPYQVGIVSIITEIRKPRVNEVKKGPQDFIHGNWQSYGLNQVSSAPKLKIAFSNLQWTHLLGKKYSAFEETNWGNLFDPRHNPIGIEHTTKNYSVVPKFEI